MQISEEEKEKRVRLANLLLADVLFLFALSKRNQDHHYLSEAFQKRYLSSVKKVTEPDQKMQRYIRKVCDSIVDTTLKGQKGGLLADSKANQPRDPYAVSMDRATNVAENEANTILNGDEYNAAIKNGCTKKRWTSYKDERVRADHADVDGQVIDINRPFHVGEYMMMYPKDDSLGAGLEEIVNCRCSVEYLYSTGARTTAEYLRRDDEAEIYYNNIRNRKNDVERIAENTRMPYDDIVAIKNHVFYNEHIFSNRIGRYTADYDMAVAWQRLINGSFEDRDILLLNHELLESKVEKAYNLSYEEAHKIAQEKYPWSNIIKELFGEDGEDGDLNSIVGEEPQ